MIDHLAQNVTFLTELWKMTAQDGAVAAYAACSRDLLFNGTTYKAAPVEPTRSTVKLGLQPDTAELMGVLDDIVTEADILGGCWKSASIEKQYVSWLNLSIGGVARMIGEAGRYSILNGTFKVEFVSKSQRLSQQIGDLTSPTDRRVRLDELGIDITPYTHAATIKSITDRRKFKIDYVQPSANYFRYGLVHFSTGANAGLEMEIKSSTTTDSGTRTEIELQLPMPRAIAVNDTANFIMGYDGSREQAKALGVVESMEAEPDLPGLRGVLTYPS
ncbi:MAG: DUF2163 domain-containing protein [Pyrinomonadaceae bacterium]